MQKIIGPKLFNCLPKEIRNKTKYGIEEFKATLDTFLSRIPDEPKMAGLIPGAMSLEAKSSNSLIHPSCTTGCDS